MSPSERRALVDRDDPDLSVAAQCRLLNVARSTLYYQPAPMDPDDLSLMRRMDELYTKGRSMGRGGWWQRCVRTA